jgi:hypothetical protein
VLHFVLTYCCLIIRLGKKREHQQHAFVSIKEDSAIDVGQAPNVVCAISSTSFGCGLRKWRIVVELDTMTRSQVPCGPT